MNLYTSLEFVEGVSEDTAEAGPMSVADFLELCATGTWSEIRRAIENGADVSHARRVVLKIQAGRAAQWFMYARDRLMSFCAATG
jgi:hypothetical protein